MALHEMPVKDPADVLDYRVDYSAWLETGDTISASTWTAETGIVIASSPAASFSDTVAIAWLTGGTSGAYLVTNHITTAGGREKDTSFLVPVRSA